MTCFVAEMSVMVNCLFYILLAFNAFYFISDITLRQVNSQTNGTLTFHDVLLVLDILAGNAYIFFSRIVVVRHKIMLRRIHK